jgi:nitrogen fixation/metabolism regulation signal transduction histidine kinase
MKPTRPPWKLAIPRPAMITALMAFIVGVILLFLLTSASSNTALFAENYPLLVALNGLLVASMVIVVALQLRSLRREYRQGVFGSRLKSRLLLILTLMAVLPGALIYAVSMQFVMNSIDSWFDLRVDRALDGGLQLARNVLDGQLEELADQARELALQLDDENEVRPARLNRLREQAGLQTATLFALNGRVMANSPALDGQRVLPLLPSTAQLREARQKRALTLLEGDAATGLLLRVLVPVGNGAAWLEPRILQVTRTLPPAIATSATNVEAAYRDYQELSLGRQGLNRIYRLALTLTLLMALLAAIALAIFLARRLAAPLLILAEGTQAVASGDFTPRAELETRDELGVLTQSFNRMTRQLSEARQETERHRAKVEAASAYLESVLANLSSGVMAFDRRFVLRANNRGACTILGDGLENVDHLPLADWPGHAVFKAAVLDGFALPADDTQAAPPREWQRQVEIDSSESGGLSSQVLLLRGSQLPQAGGGGFVVVFDDITQLIAAQRSAAWGEVARRLAHEIKNPLTPIQLSAERLQFKLSDKLDADGQRLLARATSTIVDQVEAMKNMVNSFRDYARLPQPVLAPLDLNRLVDEVLALYETSEPRIERHLAADLPEVSGDAGQLRQVIHNLLQNAQDALADAPSPCISIQTRRRGGRAELAVRDNGNGFPAQVLARAFEPYVTSKARGTGLGLAIVKKIVDEHDGRIEIENIAPHGAEIRIALPLAA